MKKSRFTENQILNILKQAEAGVSVTDLCREHGFGKSTFYKWRLFWISRGEQLFAAISGELISFGFVFGA